MSGEMSSALYSTRRPAAFGPACRQTRSVRFSAIVVSPGAACSVSLQPAIVPASKGASETRNPIPIPVPAPVRRDPGRLSAYLTCTNAATA